MSEIPPESLKSTAFIKRVEKEGSKARRCGYKFQLSHHDGRQILKSNEVFHRITETLFWGYCLYAALTSLQFHMIAHIDDTTQVLVESTRIHVSFCYAPKLRLKCSKMLQRKKMRHDKSFWHHCTATGCHLCIRSLSFLWAKLNLMSNPSQYIAFDVCFNLFY